MTPTPPQGDARVLEADQIAELDSRVSAAELEVARQMGRPSIVPGEAMKHIGFHAIDYLRRCIATIQALSAAPQTHSTDDEAGTLLERANWLYAYACTLERSQPDIISCVECMRSAAALLSRIPREEATEEDAFKTPDAIEAVMSKWQSVPSNGGYVVSQFSQAGLRITRTPGGQT